MLINRSEVRNMLKLKRVQLGADKGDGFRILVDRLWPRGETCLLYTSDAPDK